MVERHFKQESQQFQRVGPMITCRQLTSNRIPSSGIHNFCAIKLILFIDLCFCLKPLLEITWLMKLQTKLFDNAFFYVELPTDVKLLLSVIKSKESNKTYSKLFFLTFSGNGKVAHPSVSIMTRVSVKEFNETNWKNGSCRENILRSYFLSLFFFFQNVCSASVSSCFGSNEYSVDWKPNCQERAEHVKTAIEWINEPLNDMLKGYNPCDQSQIDHLLRYIWNVITSVYIITPNGRRNS